jgi:agmatinase
MGFDDSLNFLEKSFMGSSNSYDDSEVILVGAPMDFTSSYRPGSRFGPGKIRSVSNAIEEYSIYLDASLEDCSYFDSGDIELPIGEVMSSLELIGRAARTVITDGKVPLFIGGEHLITLPVVREAYKKYGDELIFVQFDAHADLRDEYLQNRYSHATVVRRIMDFMTGRNIYQLGIRSGTRDELLFAEKNTNLNRFNVLEPVELLVKEAKGRPIYVSIDIDVVDPAFANGTGTPEPGGISSSELIKAVYVLKSANVVGADVVEVSPEYDISDRTSLLAAKLLRELIIIICRNRGER